METQADSEMGIQSFFKQKTVFLTGGSGFLGKVFIEKTLRVTEVERIYVLIRSKRGMGIDERIEQIFKDPLFAKLHKMQVNPSKRVIPISGDCELPDLGLSDEDRLRLIEDVDVVVHGAATVRFNETLSKAVAINVRATMDMLRLAKQMLKLKAFVHVSSAFANCTQWHIKEQYYTESLGTTASEMCKLVDTLGEEAVNDRSDELCQNFPNTYCITKALAEEAVLSHGCNLPVCIFRPGIVVATHDDPISGWIDNFYGPISILFGAASGVLHVLYMHKEQNANLVPVDFCANVMLASAWQTAEAQSKQDQKQAKVPAIYNLVPEQHNAIKWEQYLASIEHHGFKMPITRMLWFPFVIATGSKWLFNILALLYHTIPGYMFDLLLLLQGKRTRMVKLYRKIHFQLKLLEFFLEHNWTFEMHNTRQLWQSLSTADRQMFNFNMGAINWSEFICSSLWGMRRYLAKEEPHTVPKAMQILSRLLILHRTTQLFVYGGGLTLLCITLLRLLPFL